MQWVEYCICPIAPQTHTLQDLRCNKLQSAGGRAICFHSADMHDLEFSNAKMPWFASGCGPLLEPDVKTASTRVRADNLANAARKGWNYASLSIVSGLKRKFEELRLQLIVGRHRTQLADD